MRQPRWQSVTESLVNVFVGYAVAVAAQVVIFPHFGLQVPLADNLRIGALFTVVSIARSYLLRRIFNRLSRD